MASISPDGLTVAFVGQYEGSDRLGVMNVFSMDLEGRDVKQESHRHGIDIASADGDVQLKAVLDLLKQEISADRRPVPPPVYPNKAFPYKPWIAARKNLGPQPTASISTSKSSRQTSACR